MISIITAALGALTLGHVLADPLSQPSQILELSTVPLHPPIAQHPAMEWKEIAQASDLCSQPTFEDAPELVPASWRHCAALSSIFDQIYGVFTVIGMPQYPGAIPLIMTNKGQCTFAANIITVKGNETTGVDIGDKDIRATLQHALKNYSHGSLLAVKGQMWCQDVLVDWQISDATCEDC